MFRDGVLEYRYPWRLWVAEGYCRRCKDGKGNPAHDPMVVQKGRGNGFCAPYLVCQVFRIPEGEVIYTCRLEWLLAWQEGGGRRPFPSHKGERCDVGGFWGGAVPIAL